MTEKQSPPSRVKNMSYAIIAGQSGFVTIVIVVGALLLGMWLDSLLGFRGLFTILLVVLSVPVSLMVMLRIVLTAVQAIQPPQNNKSISAAEED